MAEEIFRQVGDVNPASSDIEAQTDSYAEFAAEATTRRKSVGLQACSKKCPHRSYDGQAHARFRGVFHRRVEDFMAGLSPEGHHLHGPAACHIPLRTRMGRRKRVYMAKSP